MNPVLTTHTHQKKKKTPWSESASELYRPSDRRLSGKYTCLVSGFAFMCCHCCWQAAVTGQIRVEVPFLRTWWRIACLQGDGRASSVSRKSAIAAVYAVIFAQALVYAVATQIWTALMHHVLLQNWKPLQSLFFLARVLRFVYRDCRGLGAAGGDSVTL
jgi:hypothetical protein